MKWNITFRGVVEKFPGSGGWYYVAVPTKYTKSLKQKRKAWGMYPITVRCGNTTWKTKLMMKKGGDFFVALKEALRKEEKLKVMDRVIIHIKLLEI